MDATLTNQSLSDDTQKGIALVRSLDTEMQRCIKAERQARSLRTAIVKWHRQTEPPVAPKVWHP
jgi:hypothetical protein